MNAIATPTERFMKLRIVFAENISSSVLNEALDRLEDKISVVIRRFVISKRNMEAANDLSLPLAHFQGQSEVHEYGDIAILKLIDDLRNKVLC